MASPAKASLNPVTYPHIVKEAGYCGGKATIDNTRVRVADVVAVMQDGSGISGIQEAYPELTLAQIHAALTYYYDHVEEIEAIFAADEAEYVRARPGQLVNLQ